MSRSCCMVVFGKWECIDNGQAKRTWEWGGRAGKENLEMGRRGRLSGW